MAYHDHDMSATDTVKVRNVLPNCVEGEQIMPQELSNLVSDSFDAVGTLQGVIISLIVAITMSRYGQIVYFSVIAIIADQFVTLAFGSTPAASIGGIFSEVWDSIPELDATAVIIRFIGYILVITIMYFLKQLFHRT